MTEKIMQAFNINLPRRGRGLVQHMHERGYAIYGSTFSVALASDKTGAYQSTYVADVTADSSTFQSAFWTETRGRRLCKC